MYVLAVVYIYWACTYRILEIHVGVLVLQTFQWLYSYLLQYDMAQNNNSYI